MQLKMVVTSLPAVNAGDLLPAVTTAAMLLEVQTLCPSIFAAMLPQVQT